MATALATPSHISITYCPPMPAHGFAPFDEYVGVRPNRPVGKATFNADGEAESGAISWNDYGRMGCFQHKLASGRDQTPTWVMNDSLLRRVLVCYLEARAMIDPCPAFSDAERLARAQKKLQANVPVQEIALTKMAKQFAALKQQGADAGQLQKLGQEIEGLDTVLRMAKNAAAKVLMVAHLYYRCGLNSVEVANECELKPPHCRQILLRLRQVAASLGYGTTLRRHRCRVVRVAPQRLCRACGGPRPAGKGRRYCDACCAARKRAGGRKGGSNCSPAKLAALAALHEKKLLASSTPARQAIVTSPEFIELFQKARTRMHDPNRKTCIHGHPICAANAHVGDLRRTGKYSCNECNKRIQRHYVTFR